MYPNHHPTHSHPNATMMMLPSVLNPTVMGHNDMDYPQATAFMHQHLLPANPYSAPARPVSIVVYSPKGSALTVNEDLVLHTALSLQKLIAYLQALLNGLTKENLLVRGVEIRMGTRQITQGFPPIVGTLVGGQGGISEVDGVEWDLENGAGPKEIYWESFRTLMQFGGNNTLGKPILKVRTVYKKASASPSKEERARSMSPLKNRAKTASPKKTLPPSATSKTASPRVDAATAMQLKRSPSPKKMSATEVLATVQKGDSTGREKKVVKPEFAAKPPFQFGVPSSASTPPFSPAINISNPSLFQQPRKSVVTMRRPDKEKKNTTPTATKAVPPKGAPTEPKAMRSTNPQVQEDNAKNILNSSPHAASKEEMFARLSGIFQRPQSPQVVIRDPKLKVAKIPDKASPNKELVVPVLPPPGDQISIKEDRVSSLPEPLNAMVSLQLEEVRPTEAINETFDQIFKGKGKEAQSIPYTDLQPSNLETEPQQKPQPALNHLLRPATSSHLLPGPPSRKISPGAAFRKQTEFREQRDQAIRNILRTMNINSQAQRNPIPNPVTKFGTPYEQYLGKQMGNFGSYQAEGQGSTASRGQYMGGKQSVGAGQQNGNQDNRQSPVHPWYATLMEAGADLSLFLENRKSQPSHSRNLHGDVSEQENIDPQSFGPPMKSKFNPLVPSIDASSGPTLQPGRVSVASPKHILSVEWSLGQGGKSVKRGKIMVSGCWINV